MTASESQSCSQVASEGPWAKIAFVACDNKHCRDEFVIPFLQGLDAEGCRECISSDTIWRCRTCGEDVAIIDTERDWNFDEQELNESNQELTEQELEELIVSVKEENQEEASDLITPDPDEVPLTDLWEPLTLIIPDPEELPVPYSLVVSLTLSRSLLSRDSWSLTNLWSWVSDHTPPSLEESRPLPREESRPQVQFQCGTNVAADGTVDTPGVFCFPEFFVLTELVVIHF